MSGFAFNHGFIRGEWQKAPIPFGISDTLGETVQDLSVPAGSTNFDATTVPTGQIWVVTWVTVRYIGTVSGVNLSVRVEGSFSGVLYKVSPVVSGTVYDKSTNIYMKAGDNLRFYVGAATAGDAADMTYLGYIIDIDE